MNQNNQKTSIMLLDDSDNEIASVMDTDPDDFVPLTGGKLTENLQQSTSRKSSSSSIGSLFGAQCNLNSSGSSSSSDDIEITFDSSYKEPLKQKTYYTRRKEDQQSPEAFGFTSEDFKTKSNPSSFHSSPYSTKRKSNFEHQGYKQRNVSTSTSNSSTTIKINASTQSGSSQDEYQPSTSSGIFSQRYTPQPIPAQAEKINEQFKSSRSQNNQQFNIEIRTNHDHHHQHNQSSYGNESKRDYHQHHHHHHSTNNDYYNSEKFNPTYSGKDHGYLGPSDYPWPRNHFPAPKPASTEHLDHSRKIFIRARTDVENVNVRVKEERKLYHDGILEKIYNNIIESPKVKELDVDLIPKGLGPFHVTLKELHQFIVNISCHLCEHIVIDPVKCTNCSKWYCTKCIQWLRKVISKLNIKLPNHPSKCVCFNPDCLVKFTAEDDYPSFVTVTDGQHFVKYNEAKFTCRRNFCNQQFKPSEFSKHELTCRQGLIAEDYFFNLTDHYIHGEIIKKQAAEPTSLSTFCPGHLKPRVVTQKTNPLVYHHKSHDYRDYNKYFQLACVLVESEENPNDPMLKPERLRDHLHNLGGKYGEAMRRLKDPTLPISESEEFLQSLGVPPIFGTKPDPKIMKPRMFKWHEIPDYLIRFSEAWAKLAGRYRYPHHNQYQDLPKTFHRTNLDYICCDPLSMVPEDQHQHIELTIKFNFPSVRSFKRIGSTDLSRRESTGSTSSSVSSSSSKHSPSSRIVALRAKRTKYQHELFSRITTVNIPRLPVEFEQMLRKASESFSDLNLIFSIHMTYVGVLEEYETAPYEYREKVRQRPCWIVIVNGLMQIVYETLVGYHSVEEMNTHYHGLTYPNIRRAKNLQSIRDQVVQFLVVGKQIVGTNLAMQLTALGLSKPEINQLRPKLREVTQYFSPYNSIPCSLSLIAFLVLKGFIIENMTHSPAVEAIISIQLYMLFKEDIEKKCTEIGDGIHNRNMEITCGNGRVANVLKIYSQRVADKQADWPVNWSYYSNPRRRNPPKFDDNCARPDTSRPMDIPNDNFEIHIVDDEEELIDSFNHNVHLSHFPWDMQVQKYNSNQR